MIEQYNIISSTAAGAVPTSTAKIETPEEFTQRIESAIVPKYAKAPNGRGGLVTISKDYTWAAKLIAARDTAIRSESAALLKMCGEALVSAKGWNETAQETLNPDRDIPCDDQAWVQIEQANARIDAALAALREAGVKV